MGIRRREQWDVVGDRGNKRAPEVEVVEDTVVYGSEPLEFELEVSCMEPLEESDFVVMQERSFKNIGDPLTLLCVRQRVIDVTRNDGLNIR